MNPKRPLIALLDDIYKVVSHYVHIYDPQHADATYLKFLVEPILPEAHGWMNANAIKAGANGYYEDFRHIVPRDKHDTALCEQRHRLVDQAIGHLLTPSRQEVREPSIATVAVGLHIVCQQANGPTDFLNLYVAVATEFEKIAQTAITESIEAVERFFIGDKYSVTRIT